VRSANGWDQQLGTFFAQDKKKKKELKKKKKNKKKKNVHIRNEKTK
jgi:sterol desaturase/sphingolipid hydroxylase (fatty acid hydroxylase superfamily)